MSDTAAGADWALLAILQSAWPWLERRGVPNARRDAEELLAHTLGCTRLDLYLDHDRPLTADERTRFRDLLQRRGRREPLQYILGTVPFRSIDLVVDTRALIPRPETEELVGHLLEHERALCPGGRQRILEVGTGSGCIALSILKELPGSRVTSLDVSRDALTLCYENALRLSLKESLELVHCDFLSGFPDGRWDVLVSNPPYVSPDLKPGLQPELGFEPSQALFTRDAEGLEFYRRMACGVHTLLVPGGRIYLEIGHGQGPAILELFSPLLAHCSVLPDLAGRERILLGRLP
jgi:release factor glutamine methyltransferase